MKNETQQSWDKNAVYSVTFRSDIKTIIVTLWPTYKAIYVISFEFIQLIHCIVNCLICLK